MNRAPEDVGDNTGTVEYMMMMMMMMMMMPWWLVVPLPGVGLDLVRPL
jgi:hypothetical protein